MEVNKECAMKKILKTIWKYEIKIQDKFSLDLPINHKILSFQEHGGRCYIWVLNFSIDIDCTVKTNFRIVGTGQDIDFPTCTYIGTVINGFFVWHLFLESYGD